MKESPLNRDEKTGGLSGIAGALDGVLPSAAQAGLTGVRMPETLTGVLLDGGRPVGLSLPDLGEREVVSAWRKGLGTKPLYARCLDRRRPLPEAQVQRLARVGELWLDGALPQDGGFDLLVAGAHRLVVWPSEHADVEDLLDSLGDSAAIGWTAGADWQAAVDLATAHLVPLMCGAEPPTTPAGLDVYRFDLASRGPFTVELIQSSTPEDAADDKDDEDAAA